MTAPTFWRVLGGASGGTFLLGLYASEEAARSGAEDYTAAGFEWARVEPVGGPPSQRPRSCPSCSGPMTVDGCPLCLTGGQR